MVNDFERQVKLVKELREKVKSMPELKGKKIDVIDGATPVTGDNGIEEIKKTTGPDARIVVALPRVAKQWSFKGNLDVVVVGVPILECRTRAL